MRTLSRTLQDHDPGFLRAVCETWGLEYPSGSSRDISDRLAHEILQPAQLGEMIDGLPDPALRLLGYILDEGGRAPFPQIDRLFGPLREMGPGRRDREHPWRQPVSALEIAWYRGLLGRAFADSLVGPQEYIYIPTDLLPLLELPVDQPRGQLAIQSEDPEIIESADSSAVDDASTLLAAFRKQPPDKIPVPDGRRSQLVRYLHQPAAMDLIVQLLLDLEYLEPDTLEPVPGRVGGFLESSRPDALQALIHAWRDSSQWNDLAALPHLQISSRHWPNDARLSRSAALDLLKPIPGRQWCDLTVFLTDAKAHKPAFQRPGGDFQAWHLQDGSGAFLNGIEHWDSVDGAYLRFLLEGPAHWLGMVDLGRRSPAGPLTSFRLTQAWAALFEAHPSMNIEEPDTKITVQSSGEVIVPRGADRVTRYQIARISAWEPPDKLGHHFRLTPGTLQAASEQGLNSHHILQLLEKAAGDELPPSLVRAVERWSTAGREAQLERALLLRVQQPEILKTLIDHKTTARFLNEVLSPTVALIRATDWPALRDAAARLGLLLEPPR